MVLDIHWPRYFVLLDMLQLQQFLHGVKTMVNILSECQYNYVILSYVMSGKGWPLNYHFSFVLLSILLMTTIPILLSLPKSMETTKKA